MSTPLGFLAIGAGILLMWLVLAGYKLPWESKGTGNATQGASSAGTGSGRGGGVSGVEGQPVSLSPQIQAFFPLPAA